MRKGIGFGTAALISLFCSITVAFAAPLTWSNSMNVTITSPATTLTIATSSVADQLQVNATSVIVTMSATTGGSFTLTATSSDLTISASAGGGTDPNSCTSGVASTTISQSSGSANYTITPTGTQCTSGGGGGGGGGGGSNTTQTFGVGAGYVAGNQPGASGSTVSTSSTSATGGNSAASTSTISTTGMTTSQIQALIAQLQAQLQQLLAQAAAFGGSTSSGTGSSSAGSVSTAYTFTRNLQLWDSGADVKALQQALINANSGPAAAALAAHGASRVFGFLTLRAVKEFQLAHGIRPTGYVGAKTRAALQGR